MADENKTTKKRHVIDPYCGKRFSSEYQPSPEAKSKGWEMATARKRLFEDLTKKLLEVDAPDKAVQGAMNNLALGDPKPMIELLKMIKLPDKQEVDANINIKQALVEFVDVTDGTSEDSNTEDLPTIIN
ncbi:MAG: hypothetical protein KBT03_13815 [Bacteroidales bacterium]|nr:hypothetical protein [Candidatus Scybalousia scybalohippi]